MRKIVSLILSLIILVTATIVPMTMAAPSQYNSDVSISASLNKSNIPTSRCDRDIVLYVKTSKEVDLYSIGYSIESPAGLTLKSIESGSKDIKYVAGSNYSFTTGNVSWYAATNKSTDTIGKITYTVPANTPAGTYTFKISGVELGTANQNGGNAWMTDGEDTVALTIYTKDPSKFNLVTEIDKDKFINDDETQTIVLDFYPSYPVDVYSVGYRIDVPTGWKVLSITTNTDTYEYDKDQNHYNLDSKVVSWFDSANVYAESFAKITIEVPADVEAGTYQVGVKQVELATVTVNDGLAWLSGAKSYCEVEIFELSSLEIVTPPTKVDYIEGYDFDPTGLVVKAKYSDGTEKTIKDYVILDGEDLAEEQTYVTISWKDGACTRIVKQPITVEPFELDSIEIVTPAKKTSYYDGEDFDPTGMKVKIKYSDGSVADVTDFVIENGKKLTAGQEYVTISYKFDGVTKIAKQAIKVIKLTGIEITSKPNKTAYVEGENFDSEGMVVKAKYSDGTTKAVETYDVVDGNNLPIGKTSIKINYTEGGVTKTTTVAITVKQIVFPVESLELSRKSTILYVGAKIVLTVTFNPDNASNKSVTWESSDSSVIKVDQKGNVEALKAGKAVVTVTSNDGNKKATCEIKVIENDVNCTEIKLNSTAKTLNKGESFQLVATVVPSNATNKKVTWKSSDEKVAKVDANGLVTAIGGGKATITCTTENGQKTATCVITVNGGATPTAKPTAEPTATPTAKPTAEPTATPAPQEETGCKVPWPVWLIIAIAVVVIVIVVLLIIKKKKK